MPAARSRAALVLGRLRSAPVTVEDLRAAAADVLPALATARLGLAVVEDRSCGPVLVLEEGERRVRAPLRDLAEDLTDAGVPPGAGALAAALAAWVAERPVPDAVAAEEGVAVLDWADPAQRAVGWRVVVRRGERVLPWRPSPRTDGLGIARTRAGATERAGAVDGRLRVEGPVAVWSHPEVPALASAVLASPGRLLERVAACGLDVRSPDVVVTPRSPVACADTAVARRLAGQTGDPGVRLPWPAIAGLRWL